VNCQLYSGRRLDNRKPGIIRDREGLLEAAGESIEVVRVGSPAGVGVGTGKGEGASLIDL